MHRFKTSTKRQIAIFGPEPLSDRDEVEWIHIPLIQIEPLPILLDGLEQCENVLISSKPALRLFKSALVHNSVQFQGNFYSVGCATTKTIREHFPENIIYTAEEENQEGLLRLIREQKPRSIYWPRSSLSRNFLNKALQQEQIIFFDECAYSLIEYKHCPIIPKEVSEYLFTSPSTVEAFFRHSTPIPKDIQVTAIGPVTLQKLQELLCLNPMYKQICPMISELFSPQSQQKSWNCTTKNTTLPM